jgi:predicted tellurium resistance membrane protein TerC
MWDFSIFAQPEVWAAFATLTLMEIVLGIDNIVFITIVANKLPEEQRRRARRIGLLLALVMRLGLLFAIKWMMGLTDTLFTVLENEISGRDLILGGGGLFLIGKASHEIFGELEEQDHRINKPRRSAMWSSFGGVLLQILLLDAIFSLDSVITAVGMADQLLIMVLAMVIAVGVMIAFADAIGDFVTTHRSMKVLALAFLILIGVTLVAEGLGQHISKGYIYFAMAFSLGVELINLKARSRRVARSAASPSSPA